MYCVIISDNREREKPLIDMNSDSNIYPQRKNITMDFK